MIAVALLGYAALLLTIGAARLARARWADRAPRLAVAALVTFPLVLAAGPAAAAGGMSNCPRMAATVLAAMPPGRCGTAGC